MPDIRDDPPRYTECHDNANNTTDGHSTAVLVHFHHKLVKDMQGLSGPTFFGTRLDTKRSATLLPPTVGYEELMDQLSLQAQKLFSLESLDSQLHWRALKMELNGHTIEIVDDGSWQATKGWLVDGQLCFFYADETLSRADGRRESARVACVVQ